MIERSIPDVMDWRSIGAPPEPEAAEMAPPSWQALLALPSPTTRTLVDDVRRVARSTGPVLVTGEPGTGKTLVAEAIHALSARAAYPFVTLRAGELAEADFEATLFGSSAGTRRRAEPERAGAFEQADGGTLFLDGIGNVPAPEQERLLRAATTGEYERQGSAETRRAHPRIVSATNSPSKRKPRPGASCDRCSSSCPYLKVELPPLTARREDIEPLALLVLRQAASRRGKRFDGFDLDALDALVQHSWPGNVRELVHTVACAATVARGTLVTVEDLGLRAWCERSPRLEDLRLADAEQLLIERALVRFNGNVKLAARALGVRAAVLYRRRPRAS